MPYPEKDAGYKYQPKWLNDAKRAETADPARLAQVDDSFAPKAAQDAREAAAERLGRHGTMKTMNARLENIPEETAPKRRHLVDPQGKPLDEGDQEGPPVVARSVADDRLRDRQGRLSSEVDEDEPPAELRSGGF